VPLLRLQAPPCPLVPEDRLWLCCSASRSVDRFAHQSTILAAVVAAVLTGAVIGSTAGTGSCTVMGVLLTCDFQCSTNPGVEKSNLSSVLPVSAHRHIGTHFMFH
jgi:hypothetical protein